MVRPRQVTLQSSEPQTLPKSRISQRPRFTEFVGLTFDLNETEHMVWTVGVTDQVAATTASVVACVVSFSSRFSAAVQHGDFSRKGGSI